MRVTDSTYALNADLVLFVKQYFLRHLLTRLQVNSTSADFGAGWTIAFDGSSRFLTWKEPTGATLTKR